MPLRRLRRPEWGPYLDAYAHGLTSGRRVFYGEIRVLSPEVKHELQARWLPLHDITFDPQSHSLEVAVDNLGRLCVQPRDVFVDKDARGLIRLAVPRPDGTRDFVELR